MLKAKAALEADVMNTVLAFEALTHLTVTFLELVRKVPGDGTPNQRLRLREIKATVKLTDSES